MSTVKATHFEHPSASSPSITLGSDGSVVLPSGFTGGLGTNVVQAVKTDTFSTSSTSFGDITGLTVTITPTSATSKILLLVHIQGAAASNASMVFQLAGGNAGTYVGDAASNRLRVTGQWMDRGANYDSLQMMRPNLAVFLDSPATTSAVTYSVQLRVTSGTGYINRSTQDTDSNLYMRGPSSITAVEVAA